MTKKTKKKTKVLSAKQKRFCEEYIVDNNATQAAIRAGYSEKTACSQGNRLLTKVEIDKYIGELREKRSIRTQITADRVLEEYARIAFSDLRQVVTWSPQGLVLKESEELSQDVASAVSEVTRTASMSGVSYKIKMHNKIGALDKLAKHLGICSDKLQAQLVDENGNDFKLEVVVVDAPNRDD